jgi:hypothetical protein
LTLQTANRYKLYDTSLSVQDKTLSWLPSARKTEPFYSGDEEADQPAGVAHLMQSDQVDSFVGQSEQHTKLPPVATESPENRGAQCVDGQCDIQTPSCVSPDTGNPNVPNCQTDMASQRVLNQGDTGEPMTTGIQNNVVPGVDQDSCVQSWKNQFCPQGLNCPSGANIGKLDDTYASVYNSRGSSGNVEQE